MPQTVGFQVSLILIHPGGAEPAQTFCVLRIAPRGNGASEGSAGWGSRFSGSSGPACCTGTVGRAATTAAGPSIPGGTSRLALATAPGLEKPLLQPGRRSKVRDWASVSRPGRRGHRANSSMRTAWRMDVNSPDRTGPAASPLERIRRFRLASRTRPTRAHLQVLRASLNQHTTHSAS